MAEDLDKTIEAIETILDITEDVEKDLEDSKLSLAEGGTLILKHGVKAVKTVANLKEIGKELKDIDSEEMTDASGIIIYHFGGSEEAKAALKKMSAGAAQIYEGTKELIALRKKE
jgi:predicted Mrr-cat superfamily restriction endonuclease